MVNFIIIDSNKCELENLVEKVQKQDGVPSLAVADRHPFDLRHPLRGQLLLPADRGRASVRPPH